MLVLLGIKERVQPETEEVVLFLCLAVERFINKSGHYWFRKHHSHICLKFV